ncbi:MAG: hypothetical protein KA257_10620 [Opitutaceae bacterium]|nr:hypothetical protein [Opitutaceae bacterium]MBP9913302.1 hypothetical protein [Opitutaceae bacterium]
MELNLQPHATACLVTSQPFTEGDRVASYLIRGPALEIFRCDVLEAKAAEFQPEGTIACRWVHVYKARDHLENPDRALKLTAENLFLTLVDPLTEQTPENVRLVQFLALMLERKKILRPKGQSADKEKNLYEHARTKQLHEVPAGELTMEFFIAIQEQLSVLVGVPKTKEPPPEVGAEVQVATQEP